MNLGLSGEALAAVREGMVAVVNSRAGTAWTANIRRSDVVIAAKTGSAQAARFSVPLRDGDGELVRDDTGRVMRRFLEPSTSEWTNPEAPWYRLTGRDEDRLTHAWFIGFAPAENPQIAFAVLVEYGGSGGNTAAYIATDVIEACVEHGYLKLR